jgi:hypothetical protein
MCGNTREYPHNLSPFVRRFKNGEWQRPTEKGRGWRASIGLAGLTYEQEIDAINRDRRGYTLENVTTPDQIPVAGDTPTDPKHRRFNTVLGIWQKPNKAMTGWEPSGIAFYSLEEGNRFFANGEAMGNPFGYINLGAVTPGQPQFEPNAIVEGGLIEPEAQITETTRNYNSALGIWEKPTRDLRGMEPSVGLAGKSFREGLEYLAKYFPAGFFTVTFDGAAFPSDAFENPTPNSVPQADVEAFESLLSEEEAQAGNGPFGTPFTPVIRILPNGGMTVTVDVRAAVSLTRATIATIQHDPKSQDAQNLASFGAALVRNESNLFTDAVETLGIIPYGA